MIVVIADDFTGAAEIGGIGLRYGLKVVIATSIEKAEDTDLLIIPSNTRTMSAVDASETTRKLTSQILKLNPEFIFKKLDSTLRGNIASEIEAQLDLLGIKKAILVPGNPGMGRIVKNGHYYINGLPINQTYFAGASDFPEGSSSVVDIIRKNKIPVVSRAVGDNLPEKGIIVGDVTSLADLSDWAGVVDNDYLVAGGAGFFNYNLARLLSKQEEIREETFYLRNKSLFVLGSLYPKSDNLRSKFIGNGLNWMNMPEDIYRNRDFPNSLLDQWANEIVQQLNQVDKVLIYIDHESHDEPGLSDRIKMNIGQLVRKIVDQIDLDNLVIEGGATSFEILKSLNINKLYPINELSQGIIQMKVDTYPGLFLTTKPGSYSWPDNIKFDNTEKDSMPV